MIEPQKVAGGDTSPLRLRWQPTWADRDADYVAGADGYDDDVGRIYRHERGPHQGMWFWAMNAHGSEISRNVGTLSGVARSPRAAAHMVERAWFDAIRGSSLDQPVMKRNAYATAKAGE